MTYAVIALSCVLVGLVTYTKLSPKAYPFIIFSIGAGMVLSTTLAGPNLIGSDIHLEYYFALLRHGHNVWEPIVGIPQGTSILSYVSGSMWAYKLVYPLLFCLVPIGVYYLANRWTDKRKAFLSAFLFIAFPAFFLELPTVPRQMIAELFMVGVFLLVVNYKKFQWYPQLWIPLGISAALVPLFHYSTAIMLTIILLVGLGVAKVIKTAAWKQVALSLLVVLVVSVSYFPNVQDGAVAGHFIKIYNGFVPDRLEIDYEPYVLPQRPKESIPPSPHSSPDYETPKLQSYGSLVRTVLGEGFLDTNAWGKAFRVLNWVLAILVMWGLWSFRRTKEFWILGLGSLAITALSVIPGWAGHLNITRLIHLSLIVLAPTAIVVLKPRYIAPILIVYFLFTSGLVFEATKHPNVASFDLPYSIALSDHRIDLGATVTEDDLIVRQYIIDNDLFPIHSDFYGNLLIGQITGLRGDINWQLPKSERYVPIYPAYVYVRSRNVQDGLFTVWGNIGLRNSIPPEGFGIDWDENIVFQSGDARVIRIGD